MHRTEVHPSIIHRSFRVLALALLCFSGLSARLHAQTTATLDGIVKDNTGALVPGAKILLQSEKSVDARRTTTSNGEGFFTIIAIQPDTYDVIVTMGGFESFTVKGLEIHPGDHESLSKIALKIGQVTEKVTVSAEGAGASMDSPEKSALITADDIKRLSTVGRDATELIKFLPGFAVSTGGGLSNASTSNNAQQMGFGSSSTSSFSANGATPQTGATTVVSDGASVMDPGDMGASISNVNMDMVQEIKVETSNFGADSAKGPVVISAVGKSGGSSYHGTAYFFARNSILNSNDWYSNHSSTPVPRPPTEYYYPGANVGGPILIPGTNFNHNKKLTFFTGFEYYKQTSFDGLLLSFIPTTRMLGGDLTPDSIAQALNTNATALEASCPAFYNSNGVVGQSLSNSGGICYSPGVSETTYTQQNCLIVAGVIQASPNNAAGCVPGSLLPVDPHSAIYAKFWPKPNRTPQGGNGFLSDGYNYQNPLASSHNGYQYRGRVDENFTDSLKLYVTYNLEKINDEITVDNVYYAGSDVIPYPTPAFTYGKSNQVSINLTKVVGASLTNEVILAGTLFNSPDQLANRNLVQDSSTGWSGGRYYNNGALQLPGIRDYEEGVPDFAMGYFPANSAFLHKFSANGGDNLTKQIGRHSIKVGFYGELTANNQVPYNFTQGLNAFNHYDAGCITNDGKQTSQLHNNVANFLQGCSSFTQSSSSINADLHFKTLDFYLTDEWKATKRLTLTYGLRFDHLGAWYSPDGVGLAVWTPPSQHQIFNVTQDPLTYPGISSHKTDSSDPLSGQASRLFFYSPRAGLSYDLYGDGKTVLRGGWGAYRFHDSYNDSAGPLNTEIGIQTYNTPSNISCTYGQIQNQGVADAAGKTLPAGQGCPVSSAGSTVAPFAVYAFDKRDDQQPVTYNYNFTVDQILPRNMQIELSYVGNQSADIFTEGNLSNQNYIPLGGLFQPDPISGAVTQPGNTQQVQADYRPYPNYTQVYVPHHIAYSNYNALQASFNKQKGSVIFGVNYTWAKALGIRGDYRTGAVGDPSTLRHNYGYLGFNRNNAVNGTYSWQVGSLYKGNKFVAAFVNQWEFSGITSLQSGPDVAVLNGTSNTNFGLGGGVAYTPVGNTVPVQLSLSNTNLLGTPDINLQPTVLCDPRVNRHNDPTLGNQYINGSCFGLPKLGTNGSWDLPDTHGPLYFNTDLTVQRDFRLREHQDLQFRLAGFNFLNHPLYTFNQGSNPQGLTLNYGLPTGFVATNPAQAFAAATQNTANFGYTPFKQGYRIVELGARYNF